jgi:hypothetical protein
MQPRASKFWPSAQVTRHATDVPLSRAHLTGLSILTIKDSNPQALNHAHLWILWTIKHTVTYRTCIHTLYSFGSHVSRLREAYSLERAFHLIKIKGGSRGWRCLSKCFDRLDAKVRSAAAILLDLDLAELAEIVDDAVI